MIPISRLRTKLHREATRVARGIGRSTLATDSREASRRTNLRADFLEYFSAREIGDIVSDLTSERLEVSKNGGKMDVGRSFTSKTP
jgi:hypothetical protein